MRVAVPLLEESPTGETVCADFVGKSGHAVRHMKMWQGFTRMWMLLANSENPYFHIEIGNEKSRSFSTPGQFANNINVGRTP
jgi:hypothetical protein